MLKFLLFNVPSRVGPGGYFWPLGLIYAGSVIKRKGHQVKVVDLYDEDNFMPRDVDFVLRAAAEYKPDVIGYGGIASSYPNAKIYALALRNEFPGITQIAGGALSSTYDLLLEKAKLDFVFHGEAEETLAQWMDALTNAKDTYGIDGTSYVRDGRITRRPARPQMRDLDEVPFPDYNILDNPQGYFEYATHHFKIAPKIFDYRGRLPKKTLDLIAANPAFMTVVTSRGCSHSCSFCYRHFKGIRKHSVGYIIEHMARLKKEFNVGGFRIGDEFFNTSKIWVSDFCDALEKAGLNIFYKIAGARVSSMDKDMLVRLRDTGCFEIDYGFESGSDKILKEFGKGVTRAQNIQAAKDADEVGLSVPVQLVIGSPGEDDSTINETVSMLKEIKSYVYSLNYLIALPETPIWKYCQEKSLIPDPEEHLKNVVNLGGLYYLNLTKLPYPKVMGWRLRIKSEMDAQYFRDRGNFTFFILHKLFSRLYSFYPFLFYREKLRALYKALKLNRLRARFTTLNGAYGYKKSAWRAVTT